MKRFTLIAAGLLALIGSNALAWSNHSYAAYRAFEKMPEVASAAPVVAEPLEAFLKTQEKAIETLLAGQEAWAAANLAVYPPRPATLPLQPRRSEPTRHAARPF